MVASIVVVSSFKTVSPSPAVLSLRVLFVRVRFPTLAVPPPSPRPVRLPEMVLSVTVRIPVLKTAPAPPTGRLLLMVLLVTVSVYPWLKMPPAAPHNIFLTKTAAYSDCVRGLAMGVPKAKQPIPTAERLGCHVVNTSMDSIFLYSATYGRCTLGGMLHA